jgi:hypothetical protein
MNAFLSWATNGSVGRYVSTAKTQSSSAAGETNVPRS